MLARLRPKLLHNHALQVTRGACWCRSMLAERLRLAGQLRFNEGEPLAPELDRYDA